MDIYTICMNIFEKKNGCFGSIWRGGFFVFLLLRNVFKLLKWWTVTPYMSKAFSNGAKSSKQSIIKARLSVLWLRLVIIFLLFLLFHKTCSYIALNLAYLYQIHVLWKPAIFDCFYLHYPNYLYTLYISVNGLNFKQESVNLFPRMLLTYLNEQGNLLTHFRLLYLVCT